MVLKLAGILGFSACRWVVSVWVLALLLPLLLEVADTSVQASRSLVDESGSLDAVVSPRQEWRRKRRKNSECRLGGQWHAINTTWSPNLGPPFGVWSCVRCECNSVQKKRRRVARVSCVNIKNSCPEANCWNPVLLPGQCCKTCPEEAGVLPPQLQRDVAETQTGNDFVVLLNGRTSQSPVTSAYVATGRLSLKRSTLHFSFLLSPEMPQPENLHFLNREGDILEILEAQATPFDVNSNRVCGTWTRVPREYRQLLRSEDVYVALVPPESTGADVVSGRVARYVGADTEVFTSLMTHDDPSSLSGSSSPGLPGGGTAMVSVDSKSESLHISLIFNGIFPPGVDYNVSMKLQLTPSRGLPAVIETFVLEKVYTEINTAEILTTLGETSLPQLTRGKVHIKLWAESSPELAISGTVAARATCNVFSTVLTTAKSENVAEGERFGAGWAVLSLTDEGFFKYQVQYGSSFSNNGTYVRPTYGDLDALMRGRLQVSVVGETATLEGNLEVQAMTDAVRSSQPTLVRSLGVQWAAIAWVAVDEECVMHYHVQLAGPSPRPSWQLVLQERDELYDPRLIEQRIVLEEAVDNSEVADHSTILSQASLSRLHVGRVSFLEMLLFTSLDAAVENKISGATLLSGRLNAMSVPASCLLDNADAEKPRERPGCGFECLNTDDEDRPRRTKCIDDEKRVYEDGASWRSSWSRCEQCMCTRGSITCISEVCPGVNCAAPKQRLPGQCCDMCPANEEERRFRGPGCHFNNQTHPVGSQWHPFLPPNGFDKCVTCSCNLGDDHRPLLKCSRMDCPSLPCPPSEAILAPGSCCKTCPVRTISVSSASGLPSDDSRINREEERRAQLLSEGGCSVKGNVRANGDEWHPRIPPAGIHKCIKCACKDGLLSCHRLPCPELSCPRTVHPQGSCCPVCASQNNVIPRTNLSHSQPVVQRRPKGGSSKGQPKKGGKRLRKRKNRTNDRGRRG
ncbi:dorsal-ventral patterning protein Sog-like [Hyalella azteca]|uniref:Dorsal-ventral patterning protein Sog-like n=1 Tax=Hyalella azteca TaxID=294128 RepID=A0A8B7NUV4_HYAAZ|nr:dorsal-ventral patterning protein Sog-like [Hyalella azteca]